MNKDKERIDECFDVGDPKRYMALSVKEKLIHLHEINSILMEAMPQEIKVTESG